MKRIAIAVVALLLACAAVMLSPVRGKEATEWSLLVLVYAGLDADCDGTQVSGTMAPETRAAVDAELADFAERVRAWTQGAVELRMTVEERSTLTELTHLVGEECWPAPQNVVYPYTGFDSILVVWPPPPIDPTWGPFRAGRAAGAYASVIAAGPEYTPYDRAGAMLHEWLHTVLWTFGLPNTIDTNVGSECEVLSSISPNTWAGGPVELRSPEPNPCDSPPETGAGPPPASIAATTMPSNANVPSPAVIPDTALPGS